jgi:hypothetical protein
VQLLRARSGRRRKNWTESPSSSERVPPIDLEAFAARFAEEIHDLVHSVLDGDDLPEIRSTHLKETQRYVVQPFVSPEAGPPPIPLRIEGRYLANLQMSEHMGLDHSQRYLKTLRSDLTIFSKLDRTPLLRLEYRSDMQTPPICHWQIHAERGAFTHLLTHGQAKDARRVSRPHDLSSLHLPVGGERFRPCLEDVLQFLMCECGVDPKSGWQAAVEAGRERWRCRQIGSAVRDSPTDAARVLRDLGYSVTPPDGNEVPRKITNLRRW